MSAFIHELDGWPDLRWRHAQVAAPLAAARLEQGRLIGQLEALGFKVRDDAVLRAITDEVVKSSEIEGERLDADQVRSSVARRLGLDVAGLKRADRYVDGIVEMMLDATQQHDKPLSEERLLGWHAALFPTGRSGMQRVKTGGWRDDQSGPMQVVSGPVGRERVHFVAPPAKRLKSEMRRFLDWFNADEATEPVLKAAQAHLWFVTIHPFDDGNGRIARAITELALARSERSPQRFYSLSAQIREERADYYRVLEQTQRGSLDVTSWVVWFLECLTRAVQQRRTRAGRRAREGAVLGAAARRRAERPAAADAQSTAGGLRGQAHLVEVGDDDEDLTGLGAEGHPAARGPRSAGEGHGGRSKYELLVDESAALTANVRQGFGLLPARHRRAGARPRTRCQPAKRPKRRRGRLAGRQGFELRAGPVCKLVMARDFWP